MNMSEVGCNWGEKVFQKYKNQLKIIDARWVTHNYRALPHKTRSPGSPGAILGVRVRVEVTARVRAQSYAANEWLVVEGLREGGHVPAFPRYTDKCRLTTGMF